MTESVDTSAFEPLSDERAARALAALGNPTRLAVFRLLVRAGHDGLTVGAIQRRLDMAGSTLNHHLSALASAGLVDQTRDGRAIICTANFDAMNAVVDFLTGECCAEAGRATC